MKIFRVGCLSLLLTAVVVYGAKNKVSEMRTLKPPVLVGTAIIVIFTPLFWMVWLFLGYVADDWSSPPAYESSVPAPRAY